MVCQSPNQTASVWVIIIVHISALVHLSCTTVNRIGSFIGSIVNCQYMFHSHRSFPLMEGKLKPKTQKLLCEIHHSLMGLNNDA